MIGRDDDRRDCDARINNYENTGPPVLQNPEKRDGAPKRPSCVKARHCGILVRAFSHSSGLKIPKPANGVESVDKAIARRQQPGWGQWINDVADQSKNRGGKEHIAPLPIALGFHVVKPKQNADSQNEVSRSVPNIEEFDGPLVLKEPLLNSFFVEDVEPAFGANNLLCVVIRSR